MKSQRQKVNSRVSEVAQGVYSLGLDIGYGVVKVVTDATTIAFPSVWDTRGRSSTSRRC
jgi:hypothetical protein